MGLSLDHVAGRLYWISEYKEVGMREPAGISSTQGDDEVGAGRVALVPWCPWPKHGREQGAVPRSGIHAWAGRKRARVWGCHVATMPCLVPSPSRRCGWMAVGATPSTLFCGATQSHWAWLCLRAGSSGLMAQSWCQPPGPLPRSMQCCSVPLSQLSLCYMNCSSLPVSTLQVPHCCRASSMAAIPTTSLGAREGSLCTAVHQVLPNGLPGPVIRGCGVGTEGPIKL